MTLRNAPLLLLTLGFFGCSGSDSGGTSSQPASTTPDKPAKDATGNLGSPLSVTIAVPQVAPGEEGTKCLQLRLGNTDPVKIGRVHNTLSQISHHLIVSQVTDPMETEAPLVDCAPFRAVLIGAPLTVSQKHDDTILLPDNVAFPLDASQLMHLEMHYINTGSDPMDVTATSDLYPLSNPGPDVQDASFLVIGNLDISIPANTEMEEPWSFVTLPDAFVGANIYGATGHTHRFGTAARLAIADADGANPQTIYDPPSYTWSEAELKFFDSPVHVPTGGGFSFQCAWNNTSDATVTYGESALQEMCFFWTYYYPRVDAPRTLITGLNKSPYTKPAGASTM